ncbi:MAG TPA: hypothetical protein VGD56_16375 [Gemmatirosa sp.]
MDRAAPLSGAVPLTEARSRLFRLVEDLLTGRTDRVTLSHRGHDEDVLLVRARDVARLEAEVATLRRRAAPVPRPLRGMGRLVGCDDAASDGLSAVRADARAAAEQKLAALFGAEAVAPSAVATPRGARRRAGARVAK